MFLFKIGDLGDQVLSPFITIFRIYDEIFFIQWWSKLKGQLKIEQKKIISDLNENVFRHKILLYAINHLRTIKNLKYKI